LARLETRWRRLLGPLLVLVVAAVVFVLVFPSRSPQDGRMSALVVSDTGITALQASPSHAGPADPTSSAFAEVKKAALAQPDATGGFGSEWEGTKGSENVGSLIIYLLPTEHEAAIAQSQALSQYITGADLAQQHFTLTGRFSVPGVTGATGAAYTVAKTSTTPASGAYVTIYRVGRIPVIEFLQSATGAEGETDAVHLAQLEARRLTSAEPGFTLEGTTWSLWPSVVYWVLVLLLAVAVYFVPSTWARYRHRRAETEDRRRSAEFRGRGAKTVRRQRAPSWAQRR
jgi:hypothetical protein